MAQYPPPTVMATPAQQPVVQKEQSMAMYDEEFQQRGASMMVTWQGNGKYADEHEAHSDKANDSKRKGWLEEETHTGLQEARTKYATKEENILMKKDMK